MTLKVFLLKGSERPLGDESVDSVVDGNCMVSRCKAQLAFFRQLSGGCVGLFAYDLISAHVLQMHGLAPGSHVDERCFLPRTAHF